MNRSVLKPSKLGLLVSIVGATSLCTAFVACGSDDSSTPSNTAKGGSDAGGAAGTSGKAGTAGTAGITAGSGGLAGSAGTGGASGGSAGTAGSAGSAGSASGIVINCEAHTGNTADAACTSMATATCQLLEQCLPALFVFASQASCIDRVKVSCGLSLNAPGSGLKTAYASAVGAAYQGITCDQYYASLTSVATVQGDPTACGGPGTVADGKHCFHDAQCASGRCETSTYVSNEWQCGVCEGSAGADCSFTGCGDNLYCDSSTKKCVALKKAGSSCTIYTECEETLYCDSTSKCVARKGEGGTCSTSTDCGAGLVCGAAKTCKKPSLGALGASCTAENLSCNSYLGYECKNGTCVAGEMLKTGDECGTFDDGDGGVLYKVFCLGGSSCQVPSGQKKGTCVADAEDGAACDHENGPDCKSPAECVTKKCAIPSSTLCPSD